MIPPPSQCLSCVSSGSTAALTLRQRLLGLAVEHDVDAGEGSVSQQRGRQPREQRPDPLRLVHVPQSSRHADVVVTAALMANTTTTPSSKYN